MRFKSLFLRIFGDINGTLIDLFFLDLFFFVNPPTLNNDGFISIVLLVIYYNYKRKTILLNNTVNLNLNINRLNRFF